MKFKKGDLVRCRGALAVILSERKKVDIPAGSLRGKHYVLVYNSGRGKVFGGWPFWVLEEHLRLVHRNEIQKK